ncbi:protein of unknown function [Streptomyces sp. KY75]|nr:protein of unknown function [Streptomyces sp. KY70]CAD5989352.1 protein of unknown function [Streptomyces sp. KY75]
MFVKKLRTRHLARSPERVDLRRPPAHPAPIAAPPLARSTPFTEQKVGAESFPFNSGGVRGRFIQSIRSGDYTISTATQVSRPAFDR